MFNWTNDNTNTGLAASGIGDIASFVVAAGTVSETSTIVVTPTYTNNGISCDGPSETFTIIVNPTAQVNSISSQILCEGESTDAIEFTTTNTDGSTVFNWTNDNTNTGLAASGTGDIPSFAVTAGTVSETSTVVVTPTSVSYTHLTLPTILRV